MEVDVTRTDSSLAAGKPTFVTHKAVESCALARTRGPSRKSVSLALTQHVPLELYFLIAKFLSEGPCRSAADVSFVFLILSIG